MKKTLKTTAIVSILLASTMSVAANKTHAQLYNHAPSEDNPIKPRVELNHRYSNDRAITMTEFWVPLGQNEADGSVLFGDLRMMGDNIDNKEFNVGIGYRDIVETKLLGEGIVGGMIWFDRRQTAVDSKFNQVTVGGEWLAENYDVRVNGYVPLNKDKRFTRTNPNNDGLGFVGNQIVVNTDQSLVEEALPGVDVEVGAKIGFLDKVTDATRVYVGGYHFQGDQAENVTGWRARMASDITEDVQVGVRYQDDDVRGSQIYAEATIRLPFGHKKSFQEEGLRARLDEAPERDIDIVAASAVLDDGVDKVILNAQTGAVQNVVHVDNTAGGGGDGSVDNPFNTLAAAEAAATSNDLIYLNRGDGTTTGQDAGVTLDDNGQMLVGSGTNLIYDTNRFRTSNDLDIDNGIIVERQTADNPIITNGAGNGVDVAAGNVFVSGLIVDGAASDGVSIDSVSNIVIDNITSSNNNDNGIQAISSTLDVSNISLINNVLDANNVGIFVFADNGNMVSNVNIESNTATNNILQGLRVQANGAGSNLNNAIFTNNTTSNNTVGLFAVANVGGALDNIRIISNRSANNTSTSAGIFAHATDVGSTIDNLTIAENISEGSTTGSGIEVRASNSGSVDEININDNSSLNNQRDGFRLLSDGVGSMIDNASFEGNIADDNIADGFILYSLNDGDIGDVIYNNNRANNNGEFGFNSEASDVGSSINNVSIINNISTSNTFHGFRVFVENGASIGFADYIENTASNNTLDGYRAWARDPGSTLSLTHFSNNIAQNNNANGFVSQITNDANSTSTRYQSNIAINNTSRGVLIDDNSILNNMMVDIGGGAFGSLGQNTLSGNGLQDILIDLDGAELKAENNFWGTSAGLLPAEVGFQDGSTIDANPFLTSAP